MRVWGRHSISLNILPSSQKHCGDTKRKAADIGCKPGAQGIQERCEEGPQIPNHNVTGTLMSEPWLGRQRARLFIVPGSQSFRGTNTQPTTPALVLLVLPAYNLFPNMPSGVNQ